MVVGYPGRTNRTITFNEIKWDLETGFHETVKFLKRGIELMEENTNSSDGSKLKYRGLKSGYENYFKKISGQIDGADKFRLLISEESNWNSFLEFVEKEASKTEKDYLDALLNLIKEQQKELKQAASVADMRAKADKIERKLIVDRSKLESEFANFRLKSRQEEEFSAAERKQALLDAQVLEDQLLDKETEFLELRRDAQILENTFSRSNKENLTKEAEAIAAVNRQQASRANTARQVQREVNTISLSLIHI